MKMKKVISERLHKWPVVRKDGDAFKLRFSVLTPFRLRIWNSLVLKPVEKLFRFALVVLIVDYVLRFLHWRGILYDTPVSRSDIMIFCSTLSTLWIMDWGSRLSVSRLFIGMPIEVEIHPDKISLTGLFRKRTFERNGNLMFATHDMGYSRCDYYKNSIGVYLVRDDSIEAKVWEVFDLRKATDITTNLNQILLHNCLDCDLDVDPMRKRLS